MEERASVASNHSDKGASTFRGSKPVSAMRQQQEGLGLTMALLAFHCNWLATM